MQALHPFFKQDKIEKETFKSLAKALTEACCKGNFSWLWPSVLDIYKSNNVAKIKQMEKTKLKIGPLVVIWLTKHVNKFMETNRIGGGLSSFSRCDTVDRTAGSTLRSLL